MNEQDLLFYGQYKDYVRNLETQLLSDISAILQPINQRPEDKIIKYTTSRIKSANSTIEKLKRNGHEPTVDSAMIHLSDIVGARLVVRFIRDVYTIRNMLVDSGKFTIVKEKDYVKKSKPSGYRGYHIIIEKEIDGFKLNAEIQIRTISMDCWASLEHQLRYKKEIENADLIDAELKKCSDDLLSADITMENILGHVKYTKKFESK